MTTPDPAWNLLKAAESALMRFEDITHVVKKMETILHPNFLMEHGMFGFHGEAAAGVRHLRDAIIAYKEARNAEAS